MKYGGANKYFQKHKQHYNNKEAGNGFEDGGAAEFRRPKTAGHVEKKDSDAESIDDFETVGEKPKKPAKVPFKKQLADKDAAAQQSQVKTDSRKTSDVEAVAATVVRKASDVAAVVPKEPA